MIGAAVGSFLNVVIYRLPRGLSVNKPTHSFCPACKHRLTVPDLVPLFSWLFLRGKCRHCKSKVSSRYFIVELINGSIWAVIWYQKFFLESDPPLSMGAATAYALAYSLFASALVAAIFTDLQHYIIPDQVNAFMLLAGIGLNIALYVLGDPAAFAWGMPVALAGALVGWGALWGIALLGRLAFGKDAMGHGDIKMARGIGAILGPVAALLSFALAIVLGAVIGVAIILYRRFQKKTDEPEVIVHTEDDSKLSSLMRALRLEVMGKQLKEASQTLSKVETRINQLLDGSAGSKRKRLGDALENIKVIAERVNKGQAVSIYLSDDLGDVRLSGDMSGWLYTNLTGFEKAMKSGDLQDAKDLQQLLPDRSIQVFVSEELDAAKTNQQIDLANRALDTVGIAITKVSDRSLATIVLVPEGESEDEEGKVEPSGCPLSVTGSQSEVELVAGSLAVIGVTVPDYMVDDPSVTSASLIKVFESKARAKLEELASIKSGCKEILSSGEAPDFLFVEPISSLFKCGLGYLLCIDVVGLAVPKLYERWFGENPFSVEELEDEPVVELTMIPFGPYLAAGALVGLLAEDWLLSLLEAYKENMNL